MNSRQNLTLIALLSCLTFSQSLAVFADDEGGVAGGGGNTLNGELIETYGGHSAHELPGYDAAVKKLKALVPLFAKTQAAELEAKTIYLIPKGFDQLPKILTLLNFTTELPCYQTRQEMFCDEKRLKSMKSKQQKNLFVHELVMNAMLGENKDHATISDVRIAVALMIRSNPSAKKVAEVLKQQSFGIQYSADYLRPAEQERSVIERAGLEECNLPLDPNKLPHSYYHVMSGKIGSILKQEEGYDSYDAWRAAIDVLNGWMFENVTKYPPPAGSVSEDQRACDALRAKYSD